MLRSPARKPTRLDVGPAGVTVAARTDAGLFYGAETLWQLAAAAGPGGRIDAVHIEDAPAFAWRGVMLDSARHFQPVAYVEQLLDRMAAAKLNVFHWHLVDDQGWRLQIDRYPRLTQIGAWRTPAGAAGRDAATGKPVRYGGFYTKADVCAVVAYAAARHITIVPEIEMPGHATAAIAAYPALGSTGTPPAEPSSDWGILPNLFNPDDATFTFLDNVLDEVMALFPGSYIHVGGDEAVKDQWRANSAIQAKIKALGLKDEDALQAWFTARIGTYLAQHGRRLIGWDEILQGGVPADATVMSWRGMDGAIAAAKVGHDTVLAPSPILYLDNRQSDSADEPPGRGEVISWQRLYGFDPAPAALTADQRRHILGLQVNLFTEHVSTLDFADRMIWPRAAILAELAWSPPKKDWDGFAERLIATQRSWRALGWRSDETPLDPEVKIAAGAVALAQPAAIGAVRYTLDGSAPSAASPLYQAPLPIAGTLHLAARSFLGDGPLGQVRRWTVDAASERTRIASDMRQCANKLPLRLEDDGPASGARAIHWVDVMQACWIWPAAPLDGVTRLSATVGSVPFNFALGADLKQVTFRKPATAAGEMEVRQDGCDGPRIAVLPLAPAAANSGVTTIQGALSQRVSGPHDLCVTFTQAGPDPLWVVDRVTLLPPAVR